jgi:hypothetical protein
MIDVGDPARTADDAGRWALMSVIETSAISAATTNSRAFMADRTRKRHTVELRLHPPTRATATRAKQVR